MWPILIMGLGMIGLRVLTKIANKAVEQLERDLEEQRQVKAWSTDHEQLDKDGNPIPRKEEV